ncbi:low molecular weight phosphatase family protein [Vibrio cholerae]|nr:low molecular weight phosphatase family protein [Vibrio cholerae]
MTLEHSEASKGSPEGRPFQILTVCTGNICRSPMAQLLLQDGFDALSPDQFLLSSAGTRALAGHSAEKHIADALAQEEIDASGFRAKQIHSSMLKEADLILAMSREHRSRIVELYPGALMKTFTIREFARIAPTQVAMTYSPTLRWSAAVEAARKNRSNPGIDRLAEDDVVDPYGKDSATFRRSFDQLRPAVERILDLERQWVSRQSNV